MFIDEDLVGELLERLEFHATATASFDVEVKALTALLDRAEKTQAALLDALTREREARNV